MAESTSIISHETRLPARAIVTLPDLAIVTADARGRDPELALPANLTGLFHASEASLIADEVIPQLLDREIWSGELAVATTTGESQSAMTLWVPHAESDGTPTHATVLLGAVIGAQAKPVAPDPLTGLPSRVVLLDRLDQARRRSRRNNDLMALLFVDLDGLKSINDHHGHEAGDAALVISAELIRGCMRDGDTVARFGGDEFVVLCESLDSEDDAHRVADRILERLRNDDTHSLSASIGIAFDRGGELSAIELIRRSDTAMYRAKARGGAKVAVFDSEMQIRIEADESVRAELLGAIDDDALEVHAQPIFALATGKIIGVEMFLRMASSTGLVPASEVMRIGRDHSEAIDRVMLGRAIALAREWRQAYGRRAPRVHMNLSAPSLSSRRFVSLVVESLHRFHLHPRALAFEVANTDVVPIDHRQLTSLIELDHLGCGVVIDGYGIGPESLRLIHRIQPALVKVATFDPARGRALQPEVIVGLLRAVGSLGIASCVKSIDDQRLLERVVVAGTYAAQGNVIMPARDLGAVSTVLATSNRLGF